MKTLGKSERLNKKKVIEQLFSGKSCSFSVFPLRIVYMPADESDAPVSILVSVSKRRFKRAVKRNCMKRRIKEAYRKNKHRLLQQLPPDSPQLVIAFIYLSDKLTESKVIEKRMQTALARILETTQHAAADTVS
ncbi:MAG: ribonuclease P protein component [Mediterranea sp.]|jgi:ribonuclease P protein component|nr:ribonuclease P protein component [Mediterranea sp.]